MLYCGNKFQMEVFVVDILQKLRCSSSNKLVKMLEKI